MNSSQENEKDLNSSLTGGDDESFKRPMEKPKKRVVSEKQRLAGIQNLKNRKPKAKKIETPENPPTQKEVNSDPFSGILKTIEDIYKDDLLKEKDVREEKRTKERKSPERDYELKEIVKNLSRTVEEMNKKVLKIHERNKFKDTQKKEKIITKTLPAMDSQTPIIDNYKALAARLLKK